MTFAPWDAAADDDNAWRRAGSVCLGFFRVSRRASPVRPPLAGLSSRNPLKEACRIRPSLVQPANSISATSAGFSQCSSAPRFGAFVPVKGLVLGFVLAEARHDPRDRALAEAGADAADIAELAVLVGACEQGPEPAVHFRPAAEHDFMACTAFGLGPCADPS